MPDQTTDHTTGHPTGTVFVIVGPSGSGKDTLINWLRAELQDRREIQFVRRIVTRPSDKGHEDHDTMELAQFLSAKRQVHSPQPGKLMICIMPFQLPPKIMWIRVAWQF